MSRPSLWHLARKEARALSPTWVAAAAATVLGTFTFPRLAPFVYVYGAFALGAHALGHEYGYRTLGVLLAQPLARQRLYAIKLAVLIIMLGALAVVAWLTLVDLRGLRDVRGLLIALPPLGALAFAPWLTMVCRNQLAGTLFTGVPAGVVLVSAQWLAYEFYPADEAAQSELIRQIWFTTMGLMAPAAFALGWRTFMRLDVIEGAGRPIQLPTRFRRARPRRVKHHLWTCVAKEMQLQQISVVVAALFVAGIVWGLVQVSRQVIDMQIVVMLTMIYLAGLALLIGALASAEERQLGTHEAELMLPTPAWQRWAVKVAVAMTLSVALGAVLPSLVLSFAPVPVDTSLFLPRAIPPLLMVTTVGIYISSLSTSGVRAMAAAFPAAMAAFFFAQTVHRFAHPYRLQPFASSVTLDSLPGVLLLGTFTAFLLWLGFVNHRSIERSGIRTAQQAAGILALIAVGMSLP